MNSKRPLVPVLMNRFDDYLLKHKPVTWSARTHLVVYYAILFMAVLTLLCFIVPDDVRNDGNLFVWVTLTSILSFLGFIIWIIYLLRFNVFKRFGIAKPFDGLKTFFLYFVAIAMMVLAPYIPSAVETIKANNAFADEELVRDANSINVKICQLEYDNIQHNWDKEIVIVRDSVATTDRVTQYVDGNEVIPQYKLIDTVQLREKLSFSDSVTITDDSIYTFFSCPAYNFLRPYNCDTYTELKLFTSKEIFDTILTPFTKPDIAKTKAELNSLLQKYTTPKLQSYDYMYDQPEYSTYYNKIQKKYKLYPISGNIDNVVSKKYRWHSSNWDSMFRIFYYITIISTLLIFIFRHSTVRTFFLTFLVGIILSVLTTLLGAFFRMSEQGVYITILIYFGLFLFLALQVGNNMFRKAVSGISLNMITFFTLFVPLICVSLYYEILEDRYDYDEYSSKFENKDQHFLIAEIAGCMLLLLLLEPLFKKLYRKWFSKPEE